MFIDLVIVTYPVTTRRDLFEAPAFTHFEQGDEVVVQDDENEGKRHGIVVDSVTVTKDDDKYNFILNAMHAEKPLQRVLSKIVYREIDWKEDEV